MDKENQTMSENTTGSSLTEKERDIVELIANLAEVADDETTTQEAIDNMMERIRKSTSENIKQEMENVERESENASRIPTKNLSDELIGRQQQQQYTRTSPVPRQLFFTRIREVKSPCKAHPTDAGIDFFVPDAKAWTDEYKSMVRNYSRNPFEQDLVFIGVDGVEIAPGAHVAIPSGIKTIIPPGLAMMMVNKSGVATKLKLDHSACLIDSEYRDELIFCFFNNNQERIVIEPGMKLTQGLIVPVYNIQMQEVLNCVYDDMGKHTDRGGGFGSSGCC